MADVKATGGGSSSWEPFEIIIVCILAIALLARLQGTSITVSNTKSTSPVPTDITEKPEDIDSCGLSVQRPHSLEKISQFVTLIGTTDHCKWTSTPTTALYAQVIDSRGVPVSTYTTIPVSGVVDDTTIFNTTIPLTTVPTSSTGYLILIPAKDERSHSTAVRIPIKF